VSYVVSLPAFTSIFFPLPQTVSRQVKSLFPRSSSQILELGPYKECEFLQSTITLLASFTSNPLFRIPLRGRTLFRWSPSLSEALTFPRFGDPPVQHLSPGYQWGLEYGRFPLVGRPFFSPLGARAGYGPLSLDPGSSLFSPQIFFRSTPHCWPLPGRWCERREQDLVSPMRSQVRPLAVGSNSFLYLGRSPLPPSARVHRRLLTTTAPFAF